MFAGGDYSNHYGTGLSRPLWGELTEPFSILILKPMLGMIIDFRLMQKGEWGAAVLAFLLFWGTATAAPKEGKEKGEVWECPPVQTEELAPLRIQAPIFHPLPTARDRQNLRAVAYRLPEPKFFDRESAKNPANAGSEQLFGTPRDGYRVQVFSGVEQAAARSVEGKLERSEYARYGVYVVYEAPQYKVRLGDFGSREEALRLCEQVKSQGFPDAWVVRSQVKGDR